MVISAVPITIHLPAALWQAVQALAPHEGDATTVILRAVEEYIASAAKRRGHRSGKYQKLVKALSTPVAALHLSARPASALTAKLATLGLTLGMTLEDDCYRAAVVAVVAARIEAGKG
jgi:hypothetical protein